MHQCYVGAQIDYRDLVPRAPVQVWFRMPQADLKMRLVICRTSTLSPIYPCNPLQDPWVVASQTLPNPRYSYTSLIYPHKAPPLTPLEATCITIYFGKSQQAQTSSSLIVVGTGNRPEFKAMNDYNLPRYYQDPEP